MVSRIETRIAEWRNRLLDLTKRNRLINCKIGTRGALSVEHPDPETIWEKIVVSNRPMAFVWKRDLVDDESDELPAEVLDGGDDANPDESAAESRIDLDACLQSPYLADDHLLTRLEDTTLARRLARLALNAKTSITEQGVNVLYLAFGMLKWYESPSSDVQLLSPILLVPVQLDRSGPDTPWQLSLYEDEVASNHCLQEMLRTSYGFELPELPDSGLEQPGEREQYFDVIRALLQSRKGDERWAVADSVTLSTWSFQKLAMWQDLGANAAPISSHELCQAIAGDHAVALSTTVDLPAPQEFDSRFHPREVHTILDADSSQLEAILAAGRGASLIVDGPPGTGKSQTIANIIAECLANGRTVLFVSEKAAALEVVKRRLDARKLGDFCLECHSHKANKKEVINELGRCLQLPAERYRDQAEQLDHLHKVRSKLNAYARALHQPQGAMHITAYKAHCRLARLRAVKSSRCAVPAPLEVDSLRLRDITQRIAALEKCHRVFEDFDRHPWRGCGISQLSLSTQDDIRHDFAVLADEIEARASAIGDLAQYGVLSGGPTRAALEAALQQTANLLDWPALPQAWFRHEPRQIVGKIDEFCKKAVAHAERRNSLSLFRSEATNTDGECLLGELGATGDLCVRSIRPSAARSLRERAAQIGTIADRLSNIATLADSLISAIDRFSAALRVRIDANCRLSSLRRFVALGRLVIESGPLKPSWFDDKRREQLLGVSAACATNMETAQKFASRIAEGLKEFAFEDVGSGVAAQSEEFEKWSTRLLGCVTGKWFAFRRRAGSLYRSGKPPGASKLMDDMWHLRCYHDCMRTVRGLEDKFSSDLIRDERGRVRWDAFSSGIEAIAKLQSTVRVTRHLTIALTQEGALDRSALVDATTELSSKLNDIESALRSLEVHFDTGSLAEQNGSPLELSARDLTSSARMAEDRLRMHLAACDRILALLVNDADVTVDFLRPRFDELARLRQSAAELEALRQVMAVLVEVPEGLEPKDWTQMSATAHDMRRFLETWGETPPNAVVKVVTEPGARVALRDLQGRVVSLFAEPVAQLWNTLDGCFAVDVTLADGRRLCDMTLPGLVGWLRSRALDIDRLEEWVRFRETEVALAEYGLGSIITEIRSGQLAVDSVTDAFLARFYRIWLDAVYAQDPVLQGFRVEDHESLIAEFCDLDRQAVEGSYKRIRSKLLQNPERPHIGLIGAPPSSELGILCREVGKKRRQMALRQLFRSIPTLLPRVKPCLMMSPLAVSTFLDSPALRFDVVIFDEASQVRPFDAICAIYRGRQLIVAGDQKQLPPTSFFDRLTSDGDDEFDEESESISDFESILDVCCSLGMPRKRLRWHYRSRREPLIAFSNQHIYGGELTTFPSIHDGDTGTAVKFEYVANGRWVAGRSGGYNRAEAQKTAELIFRQFEESPDQSLGVITFSQKQMLAVLDAVDELRRQRPEMEGFFQNDRDEPFFVKNLENVQGDERDRIILCMGYGFDDSGRFTMRFGPLNVQGGERRLNVAVTRAKHQVILVSSVHATDIDLARVHSAGAKLLRAYLDYAERGPSSLASAVSAVGEETESEFETEVEYELRQRGLQLRRQVGCGGYRIDLAAVDPEEPGRFVLGIECDGAQYHSSPTARDRDRLRQEVLESLGWRICRIWSTDWVRDPNRQAERVVAVYQQAVSASRASVIARSHDEPEDQPDEKPILRIRPAVDRGTDENSFYSTISEVPSSVLADRIVDCLRRYGHTTEEDLIVAVARSLGFQRVGKRIRERIAERLAGLIRVNRVYLTEDNRLHAS